MKIKNKNSPNQRSIYLIWTKYWWKQGWIIYKINIDNSKYTVALFHPDPLNPHHRRFIRQQTLRHSLFSHETSLWLIPLARGGVCSFVSRFSTLGPRSRAAMLLSSRVACQIYFHHFLCIWLKVELPVQCYYPFVIVIRVEGETRATFVSNGAPIRTLRTFFFMCRRRRLLSLYLYVCASVGVDRCVCGGKQLRETGVKARLAAEWGERNIK